MLDQSEFLSADSKSTISVELASFQQKGDEYKAREKKEVDKALLVKAKMHQEKLQAFSDEEVQDTGLKIVILKHFYTLEELQPDADSVLRDVQAELDAELTAKVGKPLKMQTFKYNPEGVVKIKFASSGEAEKCIELMEGRFFDARQLSCFVWDGKVDFAKANEEKKVEEGRLDEFGEWLEKK